VTSNEPGYYKENKYGIRIENLILTVDKGNGFLGHETLTLFPIETKLIDFSLMTTIEKDWLNNYHEEVFAKISPLLNDDEKVWLKEKCVRI